MVAGERAGRKDLVPRDAARRHDAGASRFVRLLVAYVHTLGFFAAARIALAWVEMQEVYNRGHEQVGLVPEGSRGVVMQFVIAAQALAMVLVAPAIAKRYAYRREASVTLPSIVFGLGAFVALMDYLVLSKAIKGEAIYWNFQMFLDDGAYGFFSTLGVIALFVLDHKEAKAPPIAEAAITEETRSEANRARTFAIAVTVVTLAVMSHAVLYARQRYHASQMSSGEVEVDATGPVKRSKDGRFVYWLPDDVFESHRTRDGIPLMGAVETTTLSYLGHPRTYLSLEWWPRSPLLTNEQICPTPSVMLDASTCETNDGEGNLSRTVIGEEDLYELVVHDAQSPAAQRFLKEFKVIPRAK